MYALFTKEEKFNFTAQYGMVDYIFDTKGLSTIAKTIYQVLLGELKYLHHSNKLKIDDKGIYVEMARSVTGEKLSLCAHTVAKYIKELQRYGLLIDRRMGLKLCNRIYLKYRSDAKRYDIDKSENTKSENTKIENGQKNSGEAPASKTPQSTTLISKANEIISQLTDESLHYKTVNQMLILCKDNLDDLNAAVQYCFGKIPTKSFAAMLMDTLRKQYHKKKKERKEKKEEKKSNFTPKVSKKVELHNRMESHNWDLDAVEQAQSLRVSMLAGTITKEEYEARVAELNLNL